MPAYNFKRRFVRPIKAGLGLIGLAYDDDGNEISCEFVVDDGTTKARPFDPMLDLDPPIVPKRQTIRAVGKRRHARPGETVQLYHAQRTKQCVKIGDGRCTAVHAIELTYSKVQIEDAEPGWREIRTLAGLNKFAQSDGFADWKDMMQFWREEHGDAFIKRPFKGLLIKWEPIPS